MAVRDTVATGMAEVLRSLLPDRVVCLTIDCVKGRRRADECTGYGGLGRTSSNDTMTTDAGRNELFGNAASRQQQQQAQGPPGGAYGQSGAYGAGASGAGGYGGASGGYGAYQDRQLTAEEVCPLSRTNSLLDHANELQYVHDPSPQSVF